MDLEMRACKGCGVLYKPTSVNQIYHSVSCRTTAYTVERHTLAKDNKTRLCLYCNQERPITSYTYKNAKKCSICYHAERQERERRKQEKRAQRIEDEIIFSTTKKTCDTCGQRKPLFEFSRSRYSSDYKIREGICKECKARKNKEYHREQQIQAREKQMQERRDFLLSLPFNERIEYIQKKRFQHDIKRKYGVSIERYNSMLKEQENVCAICGNPPDEHTQLYIDHNHETGAVRGLLCRDCNFGLGFFRDNIASLQNAVDYLKKFVWLD
jgi:hypothetical protein